jgi:hypothetical protein
MRLLGDFFVICVGFGFVMNFLIHSILLLFLMSRRLIESLARCTLVLALARRASRVGRAVVPARHD